MSWHSRMYITRSDAIKAIVEMIQSCPDDQLEDVLYDMKERFGRANYNYVVVDRYEDTEENVGRNYSGSL